MIRVAFAPENAANESRRAHLASVCVRSGAQLTSVADADSLVWLDHQDGAGLGRLLDEHPSITWVQLPWAGVEYFASEGLFDRSVTFTCAKEVYGAQVGEHALVLTLACLRDLTHHARNPWSRTEPKSLFGKRVTVLGAGGIARTLVSLLEPFGCEVTVVRRTHKEFAGAAVVTGEGLFDRLPETDVLVVALALTPETTGIVNRDVLAALPDGAVLVNVARGAHVDTDALVDALLTGKLAAAGLDVTEPEPLPSDHPLWTMDNVTITPHCANAYEYATAELGALLARNIGLRASGEELEGLVDREKGY